MKAFFRGLAAAFKAEAPAQAVAGVLVLALALYTVSQSTRGGVLPHLISHLWSARVILSPRLP
jgi:hypothetical protein